MNPVMAVLRAQKGSSSTPSTVTWPSGTSGARTWRPPGPPARAPAATQRAIARTLEFRATVHPQDAAAQVVALDGELQGQPDLLGAAEAPDRDPLQQSPLLLRADAVEDGRVDHAGGDAG